MRRRAVSHDVRRLPRRLRDKYTKEKNKSGGSVPPAKRPSRKHRYIHHALGRSTWLQNKQLLCWNMKAKLPLFREIMTDRQTDWPMNRPGHKIDSLPIRNKAKLVGDSRYKFNQNKGRLNSIFIFVMVSQKIGFTWHQYTDKDGNNDVTKVPMGAWKCNFPPCQENWIDDQQTDRRGHYKVTLSIDNYSKHLF